MAKRSPGLFKRGNVWHIHKTVRGRLICETTGTSDVGEAERYLARRLEQIRESEIYGVRRIRTFAEAAARYLDSYQPIRRDVDALSIVMPFIGELPLEHVSQDTLLPFVESRQRDGVMAGTINRDLAPVKRVLSLAARVWRDGNSPWLPQAIPYIELVRGPRKRCYPLQWHEQDALFKLLPGHLQLPCLFDVNTGLREGELCNLRWDWEVKIPELKTTIFVLPAEFTKNRQERAVVLNGIARRIVDSVRGDHKEFLFTYHGKPLQGVENSAWRRAWKTAGLPVDRLITRGVHNLRHTFGHRLKAAGVSQEDRRVLLGHGKANVTENYSLPDLTRLMRCVESIEKRTETVILRPVKLAKS